MYSVVIPSLGRLEYLNELLSSIEKQTLEPQEVLLLLDDNDHCRTISREIRQLAGLRIILCPGMNLAQKRNFGSAIAHTEALVFSDDDDVWAPTRGAAVVNVLVDFGACCHNFGKFGAEVGSSLSRLGQKDRTIGFKELLQGANIFGGGSSIAARRAVVQVLPFSPEFSYCEDFEWWVRIVKSPVKVCYLGETLVSYRTHSTNMTRSVFSILRFNFLLISQLLTQGLMVLGVACAILAQTMLLCFSLGVAKLRWWTK